MSSPEALIDANVLVAAAEEAHENHASSLRFLLSRPAGTFAVPAHAFAETYSTLTRRNAAAPFHWSHEEAWSVIERFRSFTKLVGLTPGETLDAIRAYAAAGGLGPRLYDRLIGETAVRHAIPRIVTWNLAHMRSLFPSLNVTEPPTDL